MKNLHGFTRLLHPYKYNLIAAFLVMFAANLLSLAFPWFLKVVIDDVIGKKDAALLNALFAGFIVIFALNFYFGFIREYLISRIGESVISDLRNKIYWHLQRLSVQYIERVSSGRILSGVIGDVDSVRNFLFGGVIDFIYSFFTLCFVFAVLIALNWKMALIAVLYLPLFVLAFLKLSPKLEQRHGIVREKYSQVTSVLQESFAGIRVIAGFGRQDYEARKFAAKQKEILESAMKGHKLSILLWIGAEFLSWLGLVTLIWFGVKQVFAGSITTGELIAFYSYLAMLFAPVIKMAVVNNYYREASASWERIDELLSQEPGIVIAAHPVVLHKIKGNIKVENICFSYDNKKEVLSGANFELKESEVVALVGPSGAGKTTLINLLLRFYDPVSGRIIIDGYDLRDLDLQAYRSLVAVVLQDDYLFNASIAENILYASFNATEQDLLRASRIAKADDFIRSLPQGYDTQIGEKGITLSHGQRQRISIARAVLKKPCFFILDEATSNIDFKTERQIVEEAFVRDLTVGRTTLIISHRLSTITFADRILVLETGRISEAGSHQELLNKRGSYWKMWNEQIQHPLTV